MRRLVLALLLIVVLAVGWVGVRGYLAKGHLDDAAGRLPTFEQRMGDLEVEAARTTLGQVQDDTSAARDLTSDPVWRLLGAFPRGGQNLEAVGTGTATIDDVVTGGLADAGSGVERLDTSLTQAREDLAAIDRRYLIDQVDAAVTELESSLDVAAQVGTRFGEQLTEIG